MNNYNFIFPGQGSQSVGMSSCILSSETSKILFDKTSNLLGYDLLDICLNGPDDLLTKTKNTQPAIFTLSIAIDRMLKESNIFPTAVAGHSLGEYSALVSSEALSFEDAIQLVILRSSEMEKANNTYLGSMAAVINSTLDDINKVISSSTGVLVIANYNTDKQIVLSGEDSEINCAIEQFEKISSRAKCIKLNVSGAFHSPLMKFAREALSNAINSLNFSNAKVPIYQNINASPSQDSHDIKKNLILQLENPVQWYKTILKMIGKIDNIFIECGPGNVLAGINKRISNKINTLPSNSIENLSHLCKQN
jgi:[acyl-carrier-protein] S-malonyltransferase